MLVSNGVRISFYNTMLSLCIAGQLQSVHEMVGVTLEDLHADTVDQIELVTKTANILQCSDATTTRHVL